MITVHFMACESCHDDLAARSGPAGMNRFPLGDHVRWQTVPHSRAPALPARLPQLCSTAPPQRRPGPIWGNVKVTRHGRIGPLLRLLSVVVVSLTTGLFKRDWRHLERIPAEGPAILAVNHVSYADPFVAARLVWDAGRIPRFLGKAPLFEVPVVGPVLRGAGQIPVRRATRAAVDSLESAVQALHRGEVVVIYPEGTVTRDDDFWPMVAKTGVARLALLVPEAQLIPVAQWGAQHAVDWYHRRFRPFPRKTVTVSVGAPVDTSPFAGRGATPQVLRELTDLVMTAVRTELADIPPAAGSGDVHRPSAGQRAQGVARAAAGRSELRAACRRCSGGDRGTRRRGGPGRVGAPRRTPVKAAVFGAGSWGTTFAKVLVDAGTPATLWARRAELARSIRDDGRNDDYLPGVRLPDGLHATHDPEEALADVDLVAFAVPAQVLRDNLTQWAAVLPPGATLVSLMKGIELGTVKRMSEVIAEVARAEPERVAVVTGPNLAGEIARKQPTATVVACIDHERAREVQAVCSAPYFRPYTNTDVVGCELGGAIKNVIALACGMCAGMGFGDNTTASLMTRGLAETARLGAALGADARTFAGLAGMGDLVATCASPLSRNRTFGERLGRGESVEQAQAAAHGQVAEGAKSCRAILDLAQRHGVDVPLTAAVEHVCFGGGSPERMVRALMSRSQKSE